MTHVRQILRTAVVAAVTGLATTGSSVRVARVYPWQIGELPGLEVRTPGEDVAEESPTEPIQQRQVEVELIATVRDTETVADTLDAIAEEIEVALGSSLTVDSNHVTLSYAGAAIEDSAIADQPVGRITLRYIATLFVAAGEPGALA